MKDGEKNVWFGMGKIGICVSKLCSARIQKKPLKEQDGEKMCGQHAWGWWNLCIKIMVSKDVTEALEGETARSITVMHTQWVRLRFVKNGVFVSSTF